MDATILRALFLLTLAMVFVLAVRRPVRQALGAGPAFTLWLLPLLLAVLPWLPATPIHWVTLPTIHALSGNAVSVATPFRDTPIVTWLWSAWLAGLSIGLLRLLAQYINLHRLSSSLPKPMLAALLQEVSTLDPRRLRLHPAGPALLWAPHTRLLLPADFMQRFSTGERQLILRHELAHLRRGDVLWNLMAELAAVLLWFHPLLWLALPRFRLDQELACDEHVLRHSPQDEAGYAHILMHSVGISPTSILIPWLAEPQLKERLIMIQRHRPGALRRRVGYLGLAALMAGCALVVEAQSEPASDQRASTDIAYNAHMQPGYPVAAIKNREEGTVILLVQVHADGSVGSITYDPPHSTTTSADLIAAASNAARRWHFNAQTSNGKPVDGYARVPVKFSLTPLPDKIDPGKVDKSSS